MKGDAGLIPGLGGSPGGGNGILLQYSCLENPMDKGAWWATVHGVSRVTHDWTTKQAKQSISRTRVVISGHLKLVNSISTRNSIFPHQLCLTCSNFQIKLWYLICSPPNGNTQTLPCLDADTLCCPHVYMDVSCLGSDPLEQSVLQHGHSLHPARPLTAPPMLPLRGWMLSSPFWASTPHAQLLLLLPFRFWHPSLRHCSPSSSVSSMNTHFALPH